MSTLAPIFTNTSTFSAVSTAFPNFAASDAAFDAGLKAGAIAGIAIAVIVAVLLTSAAVYIFVMLPLRRRPIDTRKHDGGAVDPPEFVFHTNSTRAMRALSWGRHMPTTLNDTRSTAGLELRPEVTVMPSTATAHSGIVSDAL